MTSFAFTTEQTDPYNACEERDCPTQTDLSDDECAPDDGDIWQHDIGLGKLAYMQACSRLRVHVDSNVIDNLDNFNMDLNFRNLGPTGMKCLAAALRRNTVVEELNLKDNGLGSTGAKHVAHMMQENDFIVDLNLSMNFIRPEGASFIRMLIESNSVVTKLDLSDNQLGDEGIQRMADAFRRNVTLKYLNLSRNNILDDGAVILSGFIKETHTIEHLDISWNGIRSRGAVTLGTAMQRNSSIHAWNVAWNGFAYEGSLAVSKILRSNRTLQDLDLSCNRIDSPGLNEVVSGLMVNSTLEVLKLGYNSLGSDGLQNLISSLSSKKAPLKLRVIDLTGVAVDRPLVDAIMGVCMLHRGLTINFNFVTGPNEITNGPQNEALKALLKFLERRNLRLLDLFRNFTHGRVKITASDFAAGLQKYGIPLDEQSTKHLINMVSDGDHGEVNLSKLNKAVKQMKQDEWEEGRRQKMEVAREQARKRRIMKLNSIASMARTPTLLQKGSDNYPDDRNSGMIQSRADSLSTADDTAHSASMASGGPQNMHLSHGNSVASSELQPVDSAILQRTDRARRRQVFFAGSTMPEENLNGNNDLLSVGTTSVVGISSLTGKVMQPETSSRSTGSIGAMGAAARLLPPLGADNRERTSNIHRPISGDPARPNQRLADKHSLARRHLVPVVPDTSASKTFFEFANREDEIKFGESASGIDKMHKFSLRRGSTYPHPMS